MNIYRFPENEVSQAKNSRYLFKHLVSLGHIDLSKPSGFHLEELKYMRAMDGNTSLLIRAIDQWITQNPFQASDREIVLLFDLKEIVDKNYKEPIQVNEVSEALNQNAYFIKSLARRKLDSTIHKLKTRKLLLEAQREVAFTDRNTKQISYDLGFNHPTYFNRFFKLHTQKTPNEFREQYHIEHRDSFLEELMALIEKHFRERHNVSFYADRLHLSPKSLTRKVKNKSGKSVGMLIRKRLVDEAKLLFHQGYPVYDVAYTLGFQEPNHFSAFFKLYTGKSPSEYLAGFQKVHS